jgi:hypothetical protein
MGNLFLGRLGLAFSFASKPPDERPLVFEIGQIYITVNPNLFFQQLRRNYG